MLQLSEPRLIPELVVLVILHAVETGIALLGIEVCEVEFAGKVEAGGGADHAWFFCFRE